jgi:hypothetical protein
MKLDRNKVEFESGAFRSVSHDWSEADGGWTNPCAATNPSDVREGGSAVL